jgi:tRNA nucleotidyltransferase (CCA-adding enzyme)
VTLDFITARREFYSEPTALPTVETGNIKLDLHRRDFTINTLALRLDGNHYGKLHDYWGGYNDIRDGLVRVLHSLSFVDDPTRMLRAVRYEQRYGFHIGKRTLQLLLEARPLLSRVSGDRIRHEIDSIIDEERTVEMLNRLDELELLEAIHPDLCWDAWLQSKIAAVKQPDPTWDIGESIQGTPIKQIVVYTLWFMREPWSRTEKVIRRLRLARILKRIIRDACTLWEDRSSYQSVKPSEITKRLESVHRLSIYSLYIATDSAKLRESLHAYITHWMRIKPHTTGYDLRARQLTPGPQYSEILDRLKHAWIDGEVNSVEQERELLDELIERYQET